MEKKLITGSEGFIGKNINGEIRISRNICDLTRYDDVLNLLKHHQPDTVIHCAAKHGSALEMNKNHSKYLEENILIDLNIIKACKESNVRNLMMLASITSFPENCSYPLKEEDFYFGKISDRFFGYAYSKSIVPNLCKAYQLDYNLNYKSIFLGNVYGPHSKFNLNSTVIPNLIYRFVEAKKNNTDVYVYGDGTDKRNFIYVQDLNYLLDLIIINEKIKDPLIVSSDQICSIREIIDIIKDKIQFKNNVTFDVQQNIGIKDKTCDISLLKQNIGNYKFTDVTTGINNTIDWYLANESK